MSDITTTNSSNKEESALTSDKLTPVGNVKQVTFNPNPVTIPASETATTNTSSDSITSIKGTIPIHDTMDPTKVKNVIVSVPSNGENGQSDHTYAKTTSDSSSRQETSLETKLGEEEDVDMTSSSDDSSSDSEESDTETEKPIVTNKATPTPTSSSSGTDQTSPLSLPKKRGRPRKYPLSSSTPKSAPPPKATDTPTPRRSILKVSQSAPVTPELRNNKMIRPPLSGDRIRKRGRGCGSCVGCVREDCGKCPYCLDKPKYGGPGKKKQRCALRTCSQFVSVGKRIHTAKTILPDTPKTAAILSVAQSLVAAVHNASSNGDSIPLATTVQQAPAPSPIQIETPIIKIPEENFKSLSKSTPTATSGGVVTRSLESPKVSITSSPTSSPAAPSGASWKGVGTRFNKLDFDFDMKCVVCSRGRKLKLAKSEKFCTLRCMKSWIDSNPGLNPEDAEPNDKHTILMPPTTTIPNDAPRALKKLLINMALPGSQPVTPAAPIVPSIANTTTNCIPFTSTIMSTISNNLTTLLNAATPTPPTIPNGIKRTSQESPNIPSKKFKEAPVAVTCTTKTVTTPLITKSNKVNPNKKKGPNDLPLDVSKWGVPEVVKFFQSKPECKIFAAMLKDQEIDGPALLLLSHDSLVKCLDIKLGPALKIMTHVDQLKQQQVTHT